MKATEGRRFWCRLGLLLESKLHFLDGIDSWRYDVAGSVDNGWFPEGPFSDGFRAFGFLCNPNTCAPAYAVRPKLRRSTVGASAT